jgi:hypothetical protein
MANPFPFVAGQVLTAAELNGIGEAWTSYTPTLTQGVTVTKTVQYAKYTIVNKIVFVSVALAITGAGTPNSVINISLPVTAATGGGSFGAPIGAGGFFDLSALAQYSGTVGQNGTTSMWMFADIASAGGSLFGQFPAVTCANGDSVFFNAIYQAA